MSGFSEVNLHGSLSTERYQTRYTNKTIAIQAALGITFVLGVTLATLSHYGCVNHVFVYLGAGGAITSALTALGIFVFCRKNNLKEAFNDAQSLKEVQQVIEITQDRLMCSWTNWWGSTEDYELFSTRIHGTLRSSDVDKKRLEFSYDESAEKYFKTIW